MAKKKKKSKKADYSAKVLKEVKRFRLENKKLKSFVKNVRGYFTWCLMSLFVIPLYLIIVVALLLGNLEVLIASYIFTGVFGLIVVIMQIIYMVRIVRRY